MTTENTLSARLRRAAAIAVATATLATAGTAFALNKNDILNLHLTGLSPDVIVQVIRSSTDALTMTEAEVGELQAMGVAQPVLDEICIRIGCTAMQQGPTGPVSPVGPDLNQEIERQRQLEEERIRLEQERLRQQQEQMRERIQQEQAQQGQVQQAFAGLSRAEDLFDAGRFADAAAAYNDFLTNSAPAATSPEYYEALTGFVRAMHARGYRHAIRSRALEAALFGAQSQHFEEMFGILADIANDVGYLDPQFETMTGYTVGQYDTEFQDEFNFFLGRFFWIYGEYTRSLEYLGRVSSGSDNAAKAHYLASVMLLEQQENRRAVEELQAAVVASEAGEGNGEVAEIAYLALARIAYEIGNFDAALYYYNKIEDNSFRHPTAMFESMWTYFLKQDFDRTVGSLHALHSPFYNTWFWPELYVVEAATYLQVCNLESAEDSLAAYGDLMADLHPPVQAFIANTTSPTDYWSAINGYYDRIGTSDPVELPIEAVRYVLSSPEFIEQVELQQQLAREGSFLEADGAGLGTWGQTASAALSTDRQTRELQAGLKVSELIAAFERELTDWNIKAQEVGIEISTERINVFDTALSGGSIGDAAGSTAFFVAADWQFWPYEGEYWIDEVDNTRGTLTDFRSPDTGACTVPTSSAE